MNATLNLMTKTAPLSLALAAWLAPLAFSQTGAFEVASIHAGTFSMELLHSGGVGMKIDGARVLVRGWSLADLAGAAFRVRVDQISGPDWMRTQRFDIQAVMPPDAKADQAPEMLEALLHDRFGMQAHRGQRTASVYALTVGKGGAKLQPSAPGDTTASGCIPLSAGRRMCRRTSMEDLATLLSGLSRMSASMPPGAMSWGIDFPAEDVTGLTGTFDFAMSFGPGNPDEGGGSVMDAVEKLGLKLELQKRPVDVVYIDHIEKLPSEN
jgi:uncharacterized protein (TIGR03435 family)